MTVKPECPCHPCVARERERSEEFLLAYTPLDAKLEAKYADEFRRLVSIAPRLLFRDRLAEFEAFSASTVAQQWALLVRYAEDHREAAGEQFRAAQEELDEIDEVIAAAQRNLTSIDRPRS